MADDEPKFIDYNVTLRVSLGAAVAFVHIMETVMDNPETSKLIAKTWHPQIHKDIASARSQITAQEPANMAALYEGLINRGSSS